MRVLDVTSFFSDSCGGIKTYYREKARHLPALGCECHFVVPGARANREAFGGGTLHRIAGPRLPGNGAYRMFGDVGALVRLIRDLRPDVIEVGSHYVLPSLVWRAVNGMNDAGGGRPAVVGFFHSDVPRTLVEPIARRFPDAVGARLVEGAWRLVGRRHRLYDATFVASRDAQQALRAHAIPRVVWVGLGVDVDAFRPARASVTSGVGAPVAVYAGRLSRDKELPLLLSAFDAVHAATGARLRLVGDGPGRRAAEALAATRDWMSVEGYVEGRAALASVLASADVVITPGARETFSLTTAEAMACGTPVVAPDQGGAGELVRASGCGATFPAGSAEGLADATIAWLARPAAVRRARGARGRAHVLGSLTWRAVMARILDTYRALTGAPADADERVAA
jgi:alpha-1,6-mannosyltransferase